MEKTVNIFNKIINHEIRSDAILIYVGDTIAGYKLSPVTFHAVDFWMQKVCITFFDGNTATVSHTELVAK